MTRRARPGRPTARAKRRPLYFTFGNHMHWVDMEWLWGYHVLPGSVRDMLHLIKETGAKGNVNFDAIGYEKMAAECPEALAELRAAVKRGDVEPVGCSYGQPYGLFQGGESNIRQFTYGVRSTMRLLGTRPRSFWEEEFYFFPQLPQILKQCGYTGACLFFQWTWHTPEIPKEPTSLILWEGIDGTQLPSLPRNDLNLHQWPEDFEGVLDTVVEKKGQRGEGAEGLSGLTPAIVQWLELMPSKDWMCRSEVLLPRLKELMEDKRFEVRPRTVGGLIAELMKEAKRGKIVVPARAYSMDDVWHGMTLGKNADAHPRASARAEQSIILAEALSATASLFGRPYASWDVYPTWELDEAWRECLAAQHHDNHECEGLCGFVGHAQFLNAERLAGEVLGRAAWLIGRRSGAKYDRFVGTNALGWSRRMRLLKPMAKKGIVSEVPAFGYSNDPTGPKQPAGPRRRRSGNALVLTRRGLRCAIDVRRGAIGIIGDIPLNMCEGTAQMRFSKVEVAETASGVSIRKVASTGEEIQTLVAFAPEIDAVDVAIHVTSPRGLSIRPDAGLNSSLQALIQLLIPGMAIIADSPLAAHAVSGSREAKRKYPTGDWMTSPQWFESVHRPFTSTSFVDFVEPKTGSGLLVCHDGSQQWLRDDDGARVVLTAYDPWDEGRYTDRNGCRLRFVPHDAITNSERAQISKSFRMEQPDHDFNDSQPVGGGTADGLEVDIPPTFGPLEVCNAPNVLAHAFFRESMKSGEHLPHWAGHRMFKESGGACDHPFVIRLVEWNGESARVRLKLAGKVAMAAKTNLMGEVEKRNPLDSSQGLLIPGVGAQTRWLKVKHPVDPPWWGKVRGKPVRFRGKPITWSEVEFDMRPREIATIYADLVMGRKEFRDLDAKRKVWATVHKTGSGEVAKGQSGKVKKRSGA